MKVGFISYWGIEDPLCVSTVLPHVRLLLKDDRVSKVFLLTFERGEFDCVETEEKLVHLPLVQRSLPLGISFFLAYLKASFRLWSLHRREGFELLICRSVFAGVLGHWLYRIEKVPYTVESFEPHADYMVDNGVWGAKSWKTLLIRYFEKTLPRTAFKLYPVAKNYALRLIDDGVSSEKIEVLPCTVNETRFSFSARSRERIRTKLGIPQSAIVGIYVGKFGGIYLAEEAVDILKAVQHSFDDAYLLLLGDPKHAVCQTIRSDPSLSSRVATALVPPDRVGAYLSAADFGYALVRPTESSCFCSPIKVAEYWANGLPVVIPENIGDDSGLVCEYNLGVVLSSLEYKKLPMEKIASLHRLVAERRGGGARIPNFFKSHRSGSLSESAYRALVGSTSGSKQSQTS